MRSLRLILRMVSILFILSAFLLTYLQWQAFLRLPDRLPAGSRAAGVPVGGLSWEQAGQRVQEAYTQPIVLRYAQSRILLDPKEIAVQVEIEPTRAYQRSKGIEEFRASLWGEAPQPVDLDVVLSIPEDSIRGYLENEVGLRYDTPPQAPLPVAGTQTFLPGKVGTVLDVEASIPLINQALRSLERREIVLPVKSVDPPAPSWQHLEILLRQNIQVSGLDGLTAIYIQDLSSGEVLHFAVRDGQAIPMPPDIAFTASSVIKIPILVSVFRRLDSPPGEQVARLLENMIMLSSNDASDALMKSVLDEVRGPLLVSEDLEALGLQNTFLAGYFALGSPLLQRFSTPANERLDVNTNPDLYNQAAPADIGQLLAAIYRCARDGDGSLIEHFPGEITPAECEQMIELLKEDRQPYLITAGLPEGTPIAHKHGYGSESEVITTISDAALVLSPERDYVLVLFMNNPELLIWDEANRLAARLSETVYNYFNLPTE